MSRISSRSKAQLGELELQDADDLMNYVRLLEKEQDQYQQKLDELKAKSEALLSIYRAETSVELEEIASNLPKDLSLLPTDQVDDYVNLANKSQITTAYELMGVSIRKLPNDLLKVKFNPKSTEVESLVLFLKEGRHKVSVHTHDLPKIIPVAKLADEFLPSRKAQDVQLFIHKILGYVLAYWRRKEQFKFLEKRISITSCYYNADCTMLSFKMELLEELSIEYTLDYHAEGSLPHNVSFFHARTNLGEEIVASCVELKNALALVDLHSLFQNEQELFSSEDNDEMDTESDVFGDYSSLF